MQTTKYARLSMSANNQKLYTQFWLLPLSFFYWMVLTLGLKAKIINQTVPESKCTKKEIVDKDILITSRFNGIKATQSIKITSDNKEISHENKEFETILSLHFFTKYSQMSCE